MVFQLVVTEDPTITEDTCSVELCKNGVEDGLKLKNVVYEDLTVEQKAVYDAFVQMVTDPNFYIS